MDDTEKHIPELIDRVEEYVNTSITLLKLQAVDKTANVLATLVMTIIILLVVSLLLLVVNIGLGLWLGSLIDSFYAGFFMLGGFYAVIALLLYIFRNQWIKRPIINTFIAQLLK